MPGPATSGARASSGLFSCGPAARGLLAREVHRGRMLEHFAMRQRARRATRFDLPPPGGFNCVPE